MWKIETGKMLDVPWKGPQAAFLSSPHSHPLLNPYFFSTYNKMVRKERRPT